MKLQNKHKLLYFNYHNDQNDFIKYEYAIQWYNKLGQIHRDYDKPAIIYNNGNKIWYQNGLTHRHHDKPALIYNNGAKYYYIYGKYIKYEQ